MRMNYVVEFTVLPRDERNSPDKVHAMPMLGLGCSFPESMLASLAVAKVARNGTAT